MEKKLLIECSHSHLTTKKETIIIPYVQIKYSLKYNLPNSKFMSKRNKKKKKVSLFFFLL